jgi:hypothetical protein
VLARFSSHFEDSEEVLQSLGLEPGDGELGNATLPYIPTDEEALRAALEKAQAVPLEALSSAVEEGFMKGYDVSIPYKVSRSESS